MACQFLGSSSLILENEMIIITMRNEQVLWQGTADRA